MSAPCLIAPCLLCGRMIFDAEIDNRPAWLNQFRILYSHNDHVSITGVGYYKTTYFDCWIAPPNFNKRWDDENYDWPESHRIGVLRQPPVWGRWGFPFHEACWTLLEVALAPKPIPLQRLYDVCRSFPIPDTEFAPNWGHYYGGLDRPHPDESLCVEVNDEFVQHHRLCVTQITKLNPLNIPGLAPPVPAAQDDFPPIGFCQQPRSDVFTVLPQELRMAIATLLPTHDFLNLRLASQLFAPLFYQQRFWATRFGPGSERDWAFESSQWDKRSDWRRLYRLTSLARRSQPMHNRERVWLLALNAKQLLAPRFVNPLPQKPMMKESDDWRVAEADVQDWDANDPYRYFTSGCVTLHDSHNFLLPETIARVAFYLQTVGEVQCVVGMKVVGTCGAVVELGYMAREVVIEGCRMTSLMVAADEWAPPSLRSTAVWSSDDGGIPGSAQHLSEDAFAVMYADDGLYEPIRRSVFGGTRGQSLRYLTGLQVYVTTAPCGIEFEFLPGYFDYVDTCSDMGPFPITDMTSVQRFSIDGPGGERITGVELYVRHEPDYMHRPELYSFKVSTNRLRSRHFRCNRAPPKENVTLVPVTVPPGATITGFFCTILDDCINALGVISEIVD